MFRNKTMLDPNEKARMQQIFELHGKIQDNLTTIQSKTSKILVQQESDIIRFFHKKINEIKEKFKEERISKGEKDQEHIQKEKQLVSELEWMKNIAQKIDTENQTLVKKYAELKSEFEIQKNDRDMLLRELLMKKKKNAVLSSQIEQYEKLLQEVSKEVDEQEQLAP
jgi:chromosome segregation ATPase